MNHKIWLLFGMVLIIASMAADGLPVNDTENKKDATAEPDHSDTKDKKVETESTKPTTAPTKSRRDATTASPPPSKVQKSAGDTNVDRSRRADQSTTTSPLKGGLTTKQVPGRFKEVQAPTPPTTRSPLPKVASDRQRRDSNPATTPKSTTKSGSGKHRRAATTPSPPSPVKSGSDNNKPSTPKSRWEASSTPSPTKSTIKKSK